MKNSRFLIILTFFILGSFLLSACAGGSVVNTWPGLAASQDTVYLAQAGKIYTITASNGTPACSFPEKPVNSVSFYAAPAITDNLVVAGSYGHMLYGLSKDCPNEKKVMNQQWVFDKGTGNYVATPLVVKDTVLAPASDDKLYAVSATDGRLLWSYKTKNSLWATPASDGQVVYQPGLDHNLYALNLADGGLVWKNDLGSALLSAPLLTQDGVLYLSTMEGDVVAVKAADGSMIWKTSTGARLWATPVLHEDTLYVGNAGGNVFAILAKDGKISWQKDLGSPIIAGGAILPDGVVFPTEGGAVVALAFDGQKELWRQTINGKLYSTPVVAGQTLTVGVIEGDNLAQAYNVNGQVSWPFTAPK